MARLAEGRAMSRVLFKLFAVRHSGDDQKTQEATDADASHRSPTAVTSRYERSPGWSTRTRTNSYLNTGGAPRAIYASGTERIGTIEPHNDGFLARDRRNAPLGIFDTAGQAAAAVVAAATRTAP
jgi:hypothetical protein